jgi:hypothetical protein
MVNHIQDNKEFRTPKYKSIFKMMGKYNYVHFNKANIVYNNSGEQNPLEDYLDKVIALLFPDDITKIKRRLYLVQVKGNPDWIEVSWYHLLRHIIKELHETFSFWYNQPNLIFNWDEDSKASWYKEIYGEYPEYYKTKMLKEQFNMCQFREKKMTFQEWIDLEYDKRKIHSDAEWRREYYQMMIDNDPAPI